MHIIKLVVGDWSLDGHNQADSYIIESNLSQQEIEKAYNKATQLIGIDFIDTVASEYEDSSLSRLDRETLEKHIGKISLDSDNFDDIENATLNVDEYIDIYLRIIAVGNKQFYYKIISEDIPNINIGGYGLFNG